jgi:hypothetical protein
MPASGAAASSAKVEKINRGKHDNDCGEPKAEHVTDVVPGYSLTRFVFRHHSRVLAFI